MVSLNGSMSGGNSDGGRTHAVSSTTSFSTSTAMSVAVGTNTILIVTIGWHMGPGEVPTSRSVTWNGVAMTEVAFASGSGGGVSDHIGVYVLVAPATGANALAGSWTPGAGDVYISAIAYDGANQTTGINGADTATTNATSVATTGSADGATVGTIIRNGSTTPSVSGKTIFWNFDGNQPGGTGAYEIGGTGTQTYDFSGGTDGGSRAAAAVHVIAAGGGGGGTSPGVPVPHPQFNRRHASRRAA